MAELLQNLYEEYSKAVSNNSAVIAQFESAFRLVSYLIAGRFQDSTILSELLYSASNILVLCNDAIIKKAAGILPKVPTSLERLQNIVTVLEYAGVFIEISAERLYGELGRWVAITVLQITKSVCRFLLFVKHQVGVQAVPPLSPIDREAVLKEATVFKAREQEGERLAGVESKNGASPSVTFTLKRSGKEMRTLSTAPPINLRDWKLPGKPQILSSKRIIRDNRRPSKLASSQVWAECIYIFKPVIHLSSLYLCGKSSFKPWLLSSVLDVSSLCLMGDSQNLNRQEQSELRRRALMLALYLLRSPFYDRYTKQRLLRSLRALSDNVPGLSIILVDCCICIFRMATADFSKLVLSYTLFAWENQHVANSFKPAHTANQTQNSSSTSSLTALIDFATTPTNLPSVAPQTFTNLLLVAPQTFTNLPLVAPQTFTNLPLVAPQTCTNLPLVAPQTFTNIPLVAPQTFTNIPLVAPQTPTNLPLVAPQTFTNLPLVAPQTPTNLPLVAPQTFTNLPLVAPQTFTNIPLVAPQTFTNLPLVAPQTCTNLPLVAPQTFTNIPLVAPQTYTNLPLVAPQTLPTSLLLPHRLSPISL